MIVYESGLKIQRQLFIILLGRALTDKITPPDTFVYVIDYVGLDIPTTERMICQ